MSCATTTTTTTTTIKTYSVKRHLDGVLGILEQAHHVLPAPVDVVGVDFGALALVSDGARRELELQSRVFNSK